MEAVQWNLPRSLRYPQLVCYPQPLVGQPEPR
jgi:hypothetical protein